MILESGREDVQLVGITVAKVNFGDGVRVVGVAEEGALQGRHRHSEMLILMSDRLVAPMHFYLRGHLKQKKKIISLPKPRRMYPQSSMEK